MWTGDQDKGDVFYLRLEVGPTATHEEITRAYRRLAHAAHPDANPQDPDAARRFREITEAYEILGDPARRARYDSDQPRGPEAYRQPSGTPKATEPPIAAKTGNVGTPSAANPWLAGSPVFIGTGYRQAGPLWAGPVHVEAPREEASGADQLDDLARPVARFLSELLAPWWWY